MIHDDLLVSILSFSTSSLISLKTDKRESWKDDYEDLLF